MSDKDIFKDRERGLEESYFRKQEEELIAKMRRRVALEEEKQKISQATNIANAEVLEALQDMGYTQETIPLLYLTPVIHLAWANGKVDSRERRLIKELAAAHGVTEGSVASQRLEELLAQAPSEAEMRTNLLAIKAIYASLPEEEGAKARKSLVENCSTLAAVAKGLFGTRMEVPKAERATLERIIQELGLEKE